MDPFSALGIAASLISLTDAGIKVSFGLFSIAGKVKDADQSVQLISNDVSATCGILSQLKDLLHPKKDASGREFSIFKDDGLKTLRSSTDYCRIIFDRLKDELEKASKQVAGKRKGLKSRKIELSASEKAKWPFLQPKIFSLRSELGLTKSNLVLILSIAHLAHSEKLERLGIRHGEAPLSADERRIFIDTVNELKQSDGSATSSDKRHKRQHTDKAENCFASDSTDGDGPSATETGLNKLTDDGDGAQVASLMSAPPPYQSNIAINTDRSIGTEDQNPAPHSHSTIGSTVNSDTLRRIPSPRGSTASTTSTSTASPPLLNAWILTTVPNRLGCSCAVERLPISQEQVQQHVRQHESTASSVALQMHKLNALQRTCILQHVRELRGAELVSAGELCRKMASSVHGDVEVSVMLWVTNAPEDAVESRSLEKENLPKQRPDDDGIEIMKLTHNGTEDTGAAVGREAPRPSVRRKAPPSLRKIINAVALYDFEAEGSDTEELAFRAGDVIEIVQKNAELERDGWCHARIKGQRKLGLAPLEYLQEGGSAENSRPYAEPSVLLHENKLGLDLDTSLVNERGRSGSRGRSQTRSSSPIDGEDLLFGGSRKVEARSDDSQSRPNQRSAVRPLMEDNGPLQPELGFATNEKLKEQANKEYQRKEENEILKKRKHKEEEDKEFEERMHKTLWANGYSSEQIERMIKKAGKQQSGGGESNIKALALNRPTYIKLHRKHLDPETLNVYHLPWEWDDGDSSYIIIKRFIPEADQDVLFEHTRKIRDTRELAYSTTELNKEKDQLLLVRKGAPARTSLLDSNTLLTREAQVLGVDQVRSGSEDSSDDDLFTTSIKARASQTGDVEQRPSLSLHTTETTASFSAPSMWEDDDDETELPEGEEDNVNNEDPQGGKEELQQGKEKQKDDKATSSVVETQTQSAVNELLAAWTTAFD